MFLFVQPSNPNTACLKVFAAFLEEFFFFNATTSLSCRLIWMTHFSSFRSLVLLWSRSHEAASTSAAVPSYLPTTELVSLTLFIFLFLSKMVIRQCYAVFYVFYAFLTSKKVQFICICLKNTTSLVFHSGTLRQVWSEARHTILILLTFSFCICKYVWFLNWQWMST